MENSVNSGSVHGENGGVTRDDSVGQGVFPNAGRSCDADTSHSSIQRNRRDFLFQQETNSFVPAPWSAALTEHDHHHRSIPHCELRLLPKALHRPGAARRVGEAQCGHHVQPVHGVLNFYRGLVESSPAPETGVVKQEFEMLLVCDSAFDRFQVGVAREVGGQRFGPHAMSARQFCGQFLQATHAPGRAQPSESGT